MDSSRCWYARRIISFILVLVCCLTPALAADGGNSVYSLSADTKAVSSDRSTGNWAAYDYGVTSESTYTTRVITNNEEFWQYTNHSIARGFVNLWNKLDNIYSTTLSINTKLAATNTKLDTVNTSIGSLLSSMWGTSTSPVVVWRMNDNWDGNFNAQQVYTVADILALDSINNMYAAYWAKLNNDALWSVAGGINTTNTNLGTLNTSIGSVNSSLGTVNTNLGTIDSSLGTVNTNLRTVNTNLGTVNTNLGTVDSDLDLLTSKVFDDTSPSGNSAYYHTGVLQYSSVAYPSYLVTTSTGYKVATGGDMGTVTSLRDYLDLINRNLIVQANMVFNFDRGNSPYTQYRYNLSDNLSSNWTVRSLADSVTYGFTDIVDSVGRLATIFASDDDIQAREDADPQIQQAQEDFVSPDGAASVKLGDMGSAKDVSAQMQQSLNTGVSPSTAFSFFGTNGGLFALFTQEIKSDMDAVPQTRGGEEIVDFYHSNLEKIGVPFDDARK